MVGKLIGGKRITTYVATEDRIVGHSRPFHRAVEEVPAVPVVDVPMVEIPWSFVNQGSPLPKKESFTPIDPSDPLAFMHLVQKSKSKSKGV